MRRDALKSLRIFGQLFQLRNLAPTDCLYGSSVLRADDMRRRAAFQSHPSLCTESWALRHPPPFGPDWMNLRVKTQKPSLGFGWMQANGRKDAPILTGVSVILRQWFAAIRRDYRNEYCCKTSPLRRKPDSTASPKYVMTKNQRGD